MLTPEQRSVAQRRVKTTEEVLQRAKQSLQAAEAGYYAYQQWDSRTATTRADAETARRELARRNPPDDAESGLAQQPTSWVAYQSVQADRYLATKARALDSAREAARRLTHRIRRHTQAGESDQADRLRDPLDRNQADVARLEQEISAASEEAAKYNRELAGRPDGPQTKADASPRVQPSRGSSVPPDQPHPPPAARFRARPTRPSH
jgi:chromosome segregation ATPase